MWKECGSPLVGDDHYGARAFHGEKGEWQGSELKQRRIAALKSIS